MTFRLSTFWRSNLIKMPVDMLLYVTCLFTWHCVCVICRLPHENEANLYQNLNVTVNNVQPPPRRAPQQL